MGDHTDAVELGEGRSSRPPSVDALARSLVDTALPGPLRIDAARAAIADGHPDHAAVEAERIERSMLRPLVNATGVLLHTNLGRAPFAHRQNAAYSNLELDLTTGGRGDRSAHAGALMARASGAEAALVVNNGAAAVLLVLAALGAGRDVVVSRGELVEIGGGFRIPEVMEQSGARLTEVGTTNCTRRADYQRAVEATGADVALVMKVHRSNFSITGFTESTTVGSLVDLGPPLVVDLGSGLLDAACQWLADGPPAWLRDEPAVRQTLAAGAGLVTFSGDKLLAGPQAGIIAGRADLVAACARHPLSRALRPGGLVLGAVQEVALAYLGRIAWALPFWTMATTDLASLQARAEAVTARAGAGKVVECRSVPGGGTLPGVEIPSAGIRLAGDCVDDLRQGTPPVIGRVSAGDTILDLRTVHPSEDGVLADAVGRVSASTV